jgi:hypothetical protein
MDIFINLQPLQEFMQLMPDQMLWRLMAYYGWIILGIMYIFGARTLWLIKAQFAFDAKIKYIFLAIDVPRANEQSPKAVENLFTYLAGAHGTINFFEKWWEGKFQVGFSFEVVSIDGYTQFIIRTPADFRSLVESAVYSQYPDAEIAEIDDYTEGIPHKYPNEEYDVWGAEFIPVANHMFPIRLYEEFEHQMGPSEALFRDPMSSLMDLCSSLQKGEQLWYQILVIPTDFDWIKEADEQVDKIVGKKQKVSLANKIIDAFSGLIFDLSEAVYTISGRPAPNEVKEVKPLSMMELKPKQKKQIEALQHKAAQLGFLTKLRFVYVAKKEVYNPKKVTSGFVGYIKQFMSLDLNSFKPDLKHTGTSTAFFDKTSRLNEKKQHIVHNYINRSTHAGNNTKIMTIDELATIWHFPVEYSVKAPLLQKTPGKKAKPPMSLPSEESVVRSESLEPIFSLAEARPNFTPPAKDNSQNDSGSDAPSNLPFG